MSKIAIELNTKQIESMIDQLTISDKLKIVHKLEKETWHHRFKKLLHKIDGNLEKYPISEEEITHTVEETRQKLYDKRNHRH